MLKFKKLYVELNFLKERSRSTWHSFKSSRKIYVSSTRIILGEKSIHWMNPADFLEKRTGPIPADPGNAKIQPIQQKRTGTKKEIF